MDGWLLLRRRKWEKSYNPELDGRMEWWYIWGRDGMGVWESEKSDRQNCVSWLVSCLLIRMQISCIEKHLRAFLGSFSSLHFSPPFSSLLLFSHIQSLGIWSCHLSASSLLGRSFLLWAQSSLFLPFYLLLEALILVLLLPLPLSVCQSELPFIPFFFFFYAVFPSGSAVRRWIWLEAVCSVWCEHVCCLCCSTERQLSGSCCSISAMQRAASSSSCCWSADASFHKSHHQNILSHSLQSFFCFTCNFFFFQ